MSTLDLEEQEQLAELKAWWKRHGNTLTSVLTAALLALAAWNGWSWYQRNQSQQAAALYETVQKALAANDLKALRDAAGSVLERFPGSSYEPLAAMVSAKAHIQGGDSKTGRAQLQWVADNAKTEDLRSIARLRLAAILADESAGDEALKLLDAKPAPAYEGLYAAARGDIFLAQKKQDEARGAYRAALDKADAKDQAFKQSVQQRLDALGEGS